MGKRKKILKNNESKDKYNSYTNALSAYHPEKLEESPSNPSEIYKYYSCIDSLYVWLKNAYNDDICVLCNEMRAVLGHLSEYNPDTEERKNNLGKAYGHFRRLSIDTLKIICNGFDKEFDEWIRKHTAYDYRNIDAEYLPTYITLYYEAHDKYIEAQKSENLGSDKDNDIIKKYCDVATKFGKLYEHHVNDRRTDIEKITRRLKRNKYAVIASTVVITVISVVGAIL